MTDVWIALAWPAGLLYTAGCLVACVLLWDDVKNAHDDWRILSMEHHLRDGGPISEEDFALVRRQLARTFLARLVGAPALALLWPVVVAIIAVRVVVQAIKEAW